ncbi:hypothetical protein [Sporosarcina sp. HYO08]|uniref:hypothetical protein n=1 Tax=Sporosarcina sp. HYO08 TaxID=1759557 RepID=UPI00079AB5A9|nr:hypothetical protein [Sporosarcina sp. HYO08]KXH80855.1 hypothetical protein AU377_08985 [Sporosarcina sp. HYO08]
MFSKLQKIKSTIQIHKHFSYTIYYEGIAYEGLYDNAFMNWLNPNPPSKDEIKQTQKVKAIMNAKLHNLL